MGFRSGFGGTNLLRVRTAPDRSALFCRRCSGCASDCFDERADEMIQGMMTKWWY